MTTFFTHNMVSSGKLKWEENGSPLPNDEKRHQRNHVHTVLKTGSAEH